MSLSLRLPAVLVLVAIGGFTAAALWPAGDESSLEPTQAPASSAALEPSPPAVEQSNAKARENARRIKQLERQVVELAERFQADEARAQALPPAPPGRPSPEERELLVAQAREEFALKLDAHAQERLDSSWAPGVRQAVESGMGELMGTLPEAHRGRLLGVDCRTASCVATLEFPNYGTAMSNFARFVENTYDTRCGRTAHLDEAADPLAPFQVKILFQGCQRD